MRAKTVRDLGALVRSARRTRGLTQADLAQRLGVSRDWVVRLEHGHPRLQAQKVLDALTVVGLGLDVEDTGAEAMPARKPPRGRVVAKTASTKAAKAAKVGPKEVAARKAPVKKAADPFDVLFKGR
jgi:HTH-type transcriptional regulator/antitoxin HipB